jgi:GT2 family glycosyltransferase
LAFRFRRIVAASEVDIVNLYKVFLGRPPESQATVDSYAGRTLQQVILAIVRSEEFIRHVVGFILIGEIMNSSRFQERLSSEINLWARNVFKLDVEDGIISNNTLWSQLMLQISARMRSRPWSKWVDRSLFSDRFDAAVLNWGQVERASSITGGIDVCDAARVVGWAVDRDQLGAELVVEAFANGRFAGAAKTDRFRRDLQAVFGGDGFYGFSIDLHLTVNAIDARPLKIAVYEAKTRKLIADASLASQVQYSLDTLGSIELMLKEIKAGVRKIEQQLPALRSITSFSIESYGAYVEAYGLDLPRQDVKVAAAGQQLTARPVISIIVIVAEDRIAQLSDTLERVLKQLYKNLELIIAYTEPRSPTRALPWIDSYLAALDAPTRQLWPDAPRDGGEAARAGIQASRGDLVVCLEAGDLIPTDALYQIAKAVDAHPCGKVFFSDEDQVDRVASDHVVHRAPKFNGAYDGVAMTQAPLAGGLIALAGDVVRALEASGRLEAADPFIRLLQLCDAAGQDGVVHIARVLLHRSRSCAPPTAEDLERRRAYVQSRQDSRGEGGRVELAHDPLGAVAPGGLRIVPTGLDGVTATVIIPTRDNIALLAPCIEGLINTTDNNSVKFDIVVVDNGSKDENLLAYLDALRKRPRLRVLRDDSPFNWAALNNAAAATCTSDVLIFLNDDMLPIIADWCDELCFWALRPSTGAVGTRLLYEDGSIQHAGVVGGVFGMAVHEGVGAAASDPGYLGRHAIVRKAMAVTGACMAVRRSVFEQLGGFDALTFPVTYNDLDFCLRAAEAKLEVLYTPYASFYHFESKSRGVDFLAPPVDMAERSREGDAMLRRWGDRMLKDPAYNPHFDRWSRPFTKLRAIDRD